MNIPGFEESARVFATLVDHIDITELDCQSTTNPVEDGFLAQATWYHNFFESLKALKADGVPIDNVVFWGMDDDTSWKRTGKPLLFDGDYNPKQAFWAIMGEREDSECEVQTAIAFKGTVDCAWTDQNAYPIGRLGTYQVVYDDDSLHFQVSTSPEAAIEISLGDESYSYDADESGFAAFTIPRKDDADSIPFDIGVTVDGISDAWNSYYYNGDNLGVAKYRGSLSLGEGEQRSIVYNDDVLEEGAVDPEIEIDIADPRFNFSATALGDSCFFLENPTCWTIDTGATGLVFSGVYVSSADNQKAVLSFTGTAKRGQMSIVANVESFGQRAQGIKHSNTLTVSVGDPAMTDALVYLIARAEALQADGSLEGTLLSIIREFEAALTDAQALLENYPAQSEVDAAADRLFEVCGRLHIKTADKDELAALIDQAEKLDLSLYTVESADRLESALKNAKNVFGDDNLSTDDQADVDAAAAALQDALGRLALAENSSPSPAPENPSSSADPEPEGPSTGVEAPFAVMALLAVSAAGMLLMCKKQQVH